MTIKIGSKVKVLGNAEGTTWEDGTVIDINDRGALIDYCHPYGLYGLNERVPLDRLKIIEPYEGCSVARL